MRRAVLVALGVLIMLLVPAVPASAHPLGNFTVNRYDGVLVSPDDVRVDHVVDYAEIPTVQARRSIDTDNDRALSRPELDVWAGAQCRDEQQRLQLRVAGEAVPIRLRSASARTAPGQAGLLTLRLECSLRAPLSGAQESAEKAVEFADRGALQVGWREITVRGDAVAIAAQAGSAVRRDSVSKRLTRYPEDLLSSPLDDRSVQFTVRPGASRAGDPATDGGGLLARPSDPLSAAFAGLVGQRDVGMGAAVLALGVALLIGAVHAVAPGHGKTIMAFYLVGRGDGRASAARAAVTVGATVTLTHTAAVLVLGLVVATTASAAPASAYPWLGAVSGVVIAVVGLGLMRAALRRRRAGEHGHGHSHGFGLGHGHSHGVEDGHSHGFGLGHRGSPGDAHGHGGSHGGERHRHPHDGHPHDDHAHGHPHDDHAHGHPHDDHPHHAHAHGHPLASGHLRHGRAGGAGTSAASAEISSATPITATALLEPVPLASPVAGATRAATASTGGSPLQHASSPVEASSHIPNVVESAAAGRRRGRAGLLAVGVAGGLVPSPSALVVLLGAAAVGRAWFGVLLVVAFGIGMAVTLSVTGMLLVLARERLERLSWRAAPRWLPVRGVTRALPLLSAAVICVLGVALTVRALSAL